VSRFGLQRRQQEELEVSRERLTAHTSIFYT
jgi:hypothetical protein